MSNASSWFAIRRSQVEQFIEALGRLDAGGRARLKRNAGRTLAEARDVHRVFFQALPPHVGKQQEEDYFLIATLFPLAPHRRQGGSLGAALQRVRRLRSDGADSKLNSLDRRVQTLLDSDRDQVGFRLRQLIRLIAAKREPNGKPLPLDWEQLLLDMLNWENDAHATQLSWARDYFVPSTSTNADSE